MGPDSPKARRFSTTSRKWPKDALKSGGFWAAGDGQSGGNTAGGFGIVIAFRGLSDRITATELRAGRLGLIYDHNLRGDTRRAK